MPQTIITRWLQNLIGFGQFWAFVARVFVNWAIVPRQGRPSITRNRVWSQMYEIGTRSVSVVMITGAFVGMTLAVQGYAQFEGVGLADRLGTVINIAVVKELGPVLAALMLAGRVGGALTAELGTMQVTEQIDALRVMGADPLKTLVVPRLLACILLTPFLTIYADLMGVIGGYIISVWHFGVNSEAFWRFSADGVEKWDIMVGLVKSIFFGAGIALISCYNGFNCSRGAQGVGRACTIAFVQSFLMILIVDFALAIIFQVFYETFWTVKLLI